MIETRAVVRRIIPQASFNVRESLTRALCNNGNFEDVTQKDCRNLCFNLQADLYSDGHFITPITQFIAITPHVGYKDSVDVAVTFSSVFLDLYTSAREGLESFDIGDGRSAPCHGLRYCR